MAGSPVAGLAVTPGALTEWSLVSGNETLGSGSWDTVDVAAGLDQLIRFVHRSGRRCKVLVVRRPFTSMSDQIAEASVRRVLDIYESVQVRWVG